MRGIAQCSQRSFELKNIRVCGTSLLPWCSEEAELRTRELRFIRLSAAQLYGSARLTGCGPAQAFPRHSTRSTLLGSSFSTANGTPGCGWWRAGHGLLRQTGAVGNFVRGYANVSMYIVYITERAGRSHQVPDVPSGKATKVSREGTTRWKSGKNGESQI